MTDLPQPPKPDESSEPARPGKRLRFIALPADVLAVLAEGDRTTAERMLGVTLTDFFATEEARWVWSYRLGQLTTDPNLADWLTGLIMDPATGAVVGYGGFHGRPDESGRVELGYSVDPRWRRRGYARAFLADLLARADADPRVRIVRVTIRPDNAASLATIAGHGFTATGVQWDDRDGLETIYERPAT